MALKIDQLGSTTKWQVQQKRNYFQDYLKVCKVLKQKCDEKYTAKSDRTVLEQRPSFTSFLFDGGQRWVASCVMKKVHNNTSM